MTDKNVSKFKQSLHTLVERIRNIDKKINQQRLPQEFEVRNIRLQFQPIKNVLQGFTPWAKQQAQLFGKQVQIIVETPNNPDVPDYVAKACQQMLYHLIQNAIIHGIESVEERNQNGKSGVGTITLAFETHETEYRLTVKDDGYGYHQRHKDRDTKQRETFSNLLSLNGDEQTTAAMQVENELPLGVGLHVVRHWVNNLQASLDIQSTQFQESIIDISIPKVSV